MFCGILNSRFVFAPGVTVIGGQKHRIGRKCKHVGIQNTVKYTGKKIGLYTSEWQKRRKGVKDK
jgi:hypothetical protein